MANKILLIAVSVVLVALTLLALDDITTGTEPSHAAEWTMVAVTAAWFGGLAWLRARRS